MKGIFIDTDKTLSYETNSPSRKLVNAAIIPVLNVLPVKIRGLLGKTHKSAGEIIAYARTHRAMEVLYDRSPRRPGSRIQNFLLSIWLGTNNSKAVRNRLKLVKREVKARIVELVAENREVKIVSIASGSARAVLDAIGEIPPGCARLSATFVDNDHDAISFSQQLAGSHEYKTSFQWVKDTAENFFNTSGREAQFSIAEMVGLLEYLNDEAAVNILSKLHHSISPGGILITSNITDNSERRFISDVVGWKMTYRTADELASLLMSAGFAFDKMRIYYEPQRIHCVIVAQK